ncbi:MAG: hypothetical protein GXO78_15405 [Calditrichaeota bacterium]|nr:hypothetical protein [Calditrichota bacterium]
MLALIALLNWMACAYKVAPGGGPEDKSPPRVVATFPHPDSTGITELPYIEFQFDEAVNKATFADQVWIIPRMEGELQWQWKGSKTLRLKLPQALLPDQTYVVILGTGIQDLRGNALKAPYVLAFSTGEYIDRGVISGRVFTSPFRNGFIYAYPGWAGPDSLPFFERAAPYFTQPDETGAFRLSYLKSGTYLVIALEDQNGDGRYTPMQDRIGIPPYPVTLDSLRTEVDRVYFYLIREDTLPPAFVRVATVNRQLVKLIFREGIQLARGAGVSIQDSLTGTPLKVRYFAPHPDVPRELLLYTAPQQKRHYVGWLWGVQDSVGNALPQDTLQFAFTGSGVPDTVQPGIVRYFPTDGARNVSYRTAIWFQANIPLDTASVRAGFQLLDADSVVVPGEWDWSSWLMPRFRPRSLLKKNATYRIFLNLARFKTIDGRAFGDSILVMTFQTWDWAELGEIEGTVQVVDSLKTYPVWVEVFSLSEQRRLDAVEARNGQFMIPFLPDGKYRLRAFVDRNRNQRLDGGSTRPFQFAEPFVWFPDTVKVRKRWTTQGIEIRFGK